MLRFFDYIYYKLCQFYYKHGQGSASGISGLALLSLIQFLNLLSIITVFWLIFPYKFILTTGDKLLGALIYIIIIIINGIRYNKMNYDVLKERWDNQDTVIQRKKKTGVISYILITIFIVVALVCRKLIFSGGV